MLLGLAPALLAKELERPGAIPPTHQGTGGFAIGAAAAPPDIRRAKAQLHAATARIGVAVADLFPKFNLTGSLGWAANDINKIGTQNSKFWSFSPTVTWPVFAGGKILWNIKVQNALEEQALLTYQQTVLTALKEVETALVAYVKEQEHRQALAQAVASNRQAVDLAMTLYVAGKTDFLNVLTAQLALFSTEDALAQSTRSLDTDLVAIYKALGGGWEEGDKFEGGLRVAIPYPPQKSLKQGGFHELFHQTWKKSCRPGRHRSLLPYGPGSGHHDQPLRLLLLFRVQPRVPLSLPVRRTRWTADFFLPHMILPPPCSCRACGSWARSSLWRAPSSSSFAPSRFTWGKSSAGASPTGVCTATSATPNIWPWASGASAWPSSGPVSSSWYSSLMFILYYFLARDEERRMISQYGTSYEECLSSRGMFLPLALERPAHRLFERLLPLPGPPPPGHPPAHRLGGPGERLSPPGPHCPFSALATRGNLTVVPILPEDAARGDKILAAVLADEAAGALPFLDPGKSSLGLRLAPDCIMRGVIADARGRQATMCSSATGAAALITDWVLHPFEHLRQPRAARIGGHAPRLDPGDGPAAPLPTFHLNRPDLDCATCPYRRVIFR